MVCCCLSCARYSCLTNVNVQSCWTYWPFKLEEQGQTFSCYVELTQSWFSCKIRALPHCLESFSKTESGGYSFISPSQGQCWSISLMISSDSLGPLNWTNDMLILEDSDWDLILTCDTKGEFMCKPSIILCNCCPSSINCAHHIVAG